jgi:hypothetical protein
VAGPRWVPDTKADWPADCRSQYNFDFDIENQSNIRGLNLAGRQDEDKQRQ